MEAEVGDTEGEAKIKKVQDETKVEEAVNDSKNSETRADQADEFSPGTQQLKGSIFSPADAGPPVLPCTFPQRARTLRIQAAPHLETEVSAQKQAQLRVDFQDDFRIDQGDLQKTLQDIALHDVADSLILIESSNDTVSAKIADRDPSPGAHGQHLKLGTPSSRSALDDSERVEAVDYSQIFLTPKERDEVGDSARDETPQILKTQIVRQRTVMEAQDNKHVHWEQEYVPETPRKSQMLQRKLRGDKFKSMDLGSGVQQRVSPPGKTSEIDQFEVSDVDFLARSEDSLETPRGAGDRIQARERELEDQEERIDFLATPRGEQPEEGDHDEAGDGLREVGAETPDRKLQLDILRVQWVDQEKYAAFATPRGRRLSPQVQRGPLVASLASGGNSGRQSPQATPLRTTHRPGAERTLEDLLSEAGKESAAEESSVSVYQ